MKKWFSFILTLALLASLPACGQPKAAGPLQVLVDIEFAGGFSNVDASPLCDNLLFNLSLMEGAPQGVEFQYLPQEGEEREAALAHVRTEILSGKGPDLFLCSTEYPTSDAQALFRFPEQAMGRRIFLPLDPYMETARLMEWGKLVPAVMEAGRSEAGQELLPLAFTLPVTCYRQSQVQHQPSQSMTYAEMEQGGPALFAASIPPGANSFTALSSYFTTLADWQAEELTFTEEELLAWLLKVQQKWESYYSWDKETGLQKSGDAPPFFQFGLQVGYLEDLSAMTTQYENDPFDGIDTGKEPLAFVPFYSKDGGYVATVTCFGAVNRNSARPEDAFFILDYLLSAEGQRSSFTSRFTQACAWPVYQGICSQALRGPEKYYTLDENIAALGTLLDNLAGARFASALDTEIWNLDVALSQNDYAKSQGEPFQPPEKLAEEAYRTMKMMVAES